ncbi:5-formyltetrahydrofolate cyclo-ligase [Corynebacterium sp. H130]|uniref:5-formyltetrahydrofolate cyclo-ligase n=1 Tax=Corynebacterium sp. H130 TaxID=3133444 RepID=UPI0030A6C530
MTQPDAKRALRTQLFDARRTLPSDERNIANMAIQQELLTFLQVHGATSVAAYMPTPSEPGGTDLVPVLRKAGLEVLIPISGKDSTLSWVRVDDDTEFVSGAFGISEPTGPALQGQPLADVDVIIVPALAANFSGYRLGKGGGYYDRALSELSQPATVSILFDHEVLDVIPLEEHDARTAAIITPTQILRIMEPFGPDDPSK